MTDGKPSSCLVYANDNFQYDLSINVSMIVLSILSLVANFLLIFSYSMVICYRSKSK